RRRSNSRCDPLASTLASCNQICGKNVTLTSAGAMRRFSITRVPDMVLADVHLSDIIWSLLWLFFLFIWIMILVQVLIDLFRDHEMSGVAKALWVIALVFLPFITVFVY